MASKQAELMIRTLSKRRQWESEWRAKNGMDEDVEGERVNASANEKKRIYEVKKKFACVCVLKDGDGNSSRPKYVRPRYRIAYFRNTSL